MPLPFRLRGEGDPSKRRTLWLALAFSLVLHGLLFGLIFSRLRIDGQRPPPITVALLTEEADAPSVITPAVPQRALATPLPAASRQPHRARLGFPPVESATSPIAVARSPEPATGAPPDVAAAPASASIGAPRSVFVEGEIDSAPRPALRIRPRYPEHARLMARESDVQLLVTVEADGHVSRVDLVSSGGEEFDREAEDAVVQARFIAAQKGGEPVAALVRFTVRFRLDE